MVLLMDGEALNGALKEMERLSNGALKGWRGFRMVLSKDGEALGSGGALRCLRALLPKCHGMG
jgi:hypothetical protein